MAAECRHFYPLAGTPAFVHSARRIPWTNEGPTVVGPPGGSGPWVFDAEKFTEHLLARLATDGPHDLLYLDLESPTSAGREWVDADTILFRRALGMAHVLTEGRTAIGVYGKHDAPYWFLDKPATETPDLIHTHVEGICSAVFVSAYANSRVVDPAARHADNLARIIELLDRYAELHRRGKPLVAFIWHQWKRGYPQTGRETMPEGYFLEYVQAIAAHPDVTHLCWFGGSGTIDAAYWPVFREAAA